MEEEKETILQVPVEEVVEDNEAWLAGRILTQESFNSKAFMTIMAQI